MEGTRFPNRARRPRWAAAVVAGLCAVPAAAGPARAGELFSVERTLYRVAEGTHVPRFVYDTAGDARQDPACPRYPGLTKGGEVWSRTYVDGASQVKIRFRLWTRYDEPVAVAKRAFEDTHGRRASCRELYAAEGFRRDYGPDRREIESLKWVACNGSARHSRWCALMSLPPSQRPAGVNPNLNERCRAPRYNNGRWRGPATYAGWHDANVRFDEVDLIEEGVDAGELPGWVPGHVSATVFVDDYEQMGGVAWGPGGEQFHVATNPDGTPTYVGRGNVTTWAAAELHAAWYDHQARRLGKDPVRNPRAAHQAVRDRMNGAPNGALAAEYERVVTALCAATPTIASVIDAPGDASGFGRPSDVAIDQMIRGWVDQEVAARTGRARDNYVCRALRADPAVRSFAAAGCQYWVFPWLLHQIWANPGCMNRPADPVANVLGVDLGCGRRAHFQGLMLRFRDFLDE
jgi:hypothetical protein